METENNKLLYLDETKQLLKEKINYLGGNLTPESTFRSYSDALNNIYEKYPKISDSGTDINLVNTKQGKLTTELNPSEISQESTTGKNLLPYPYVDTSKTASGVTITVNNDGSIILNGTATGTVYFNFATTAHTFLLKAGTYTMSLQQAGIEFSATTTNETLGYITKSNTSATFTINEDTNIRSFIAIRAEQTFNNFVVKPMIESGSSATNWEKPTNGPAPNPNYPFPIHTVSGENNIKIENKNLFYYNKATQVVNNVNFVINEDKSIIANGTASSNTYWKLGELYLPRDGTYYISGSPSDGSSSTYRITCYLHDENGTYLSAHSDTGTGVSFSGNKGYRLDYYIYIANGVTVTNKVFKPMVTQGSIATDYVPYQEQNYVIHLGDLEYCKIGDYKDQIFKNTINSPYYDSTLNENEWYMKKNIGKVVLNGSETWYLALEGVNTNLYYNQRTQMSSDVLSDYFTRNENLYTEDVEGIRGLSNNNRIWIRINKTIGSNVNNFKSWLSTHNTEVYYILNSPEYINITENYPTLATQLENLTKNIKSYDNETNINQINNDLSFYINAKALKKNA